VAPGGRKRRSAILLVGALLVVAVGAAVSIAGATPNVTIGALSPSVSPSLAIGASAPSSTPTSPVVPIATAATPSPRPQGIVARRIRIPRLQIDLRIIEGDGVDAPMNKAAHYPGSAWPGDGSNTYIYAHAQTGMFLTLWDAKVGDEIFLDLVDGTSRRYLVSEVRPRVRWNAMEYLDPTPTEQLTLQTSTSYTATAPRFIVIAEPAA
jgi:LPXTG-site transpeptidase (sortase) family protein